MSSNGFIKDAKRGKCHMCLRTRNVIPHLKKVAEVNHGFAQGYIWECKDADECDSVLDKKIKEHPHDTAIGDQLRFNREHGRIKEYQYRS